MIDYTKPSTEFRIVEVTVTSTISDIGAAAAKALPPGCRYRYAHGIAYRLEDGREIPSSARGLTKPKLANRLASLRASAKNGELFASFRGGEYVGTVQKFCLNMR